MRLIDADEMLVNEFEVYMSAQLTVDELTRRINEVVHMKIQKLILDTPTIEAELVKHGEWVCDYDCGCTKCSICGEYDALSRDDYFYRGGKIRDNNSSYCPNCGAKMDGGKNHDD